MATRRPRPARSARRRSRSASGNGALVFNHTSSAYTFAPNITGYGTIDVAGGTTIFTGNDSGFTGATSVGNATLEADSSLGGTVYVGSNGTLQGNGTLGTVNLANGATIIPGKSQSGPIGTLTIGGAYTQSGTSTMIVAISPTTSSVLNVGGAASLAGTLVLSPSAGFYTAGKTYTIISANSVSGTFGTVTNAAPSVTSFTTSYGSKDVVVAVAGPGGSSPALGPIASAGVTTDQVSLGKTLDNLTTAGTGNANFSTALTALSVMNTAAKQQALAQLVGTAGSNLPVAANGSTHAIFNSIGAHLANNGNGSNFTLGNDFGSKGEVQVADASGIYWGPDRSLLSDYSVWMEGIGSATRLGSTNVAPGGTSVLGGATIGGEYHPSRATRLGVALGAASASSSVASGNQSGTQQTYALALYASHDWRHWEWDVSALGSVNDASTQRAIGFLGEEAMGKTSGYGFGLNTGVGYKFKLDAANTTLTPRLGIDYSFNHENGYTETGAPGADLAIDAHNQNFLQTSLDATLATQFDIPHTDGLLDTLTPQLSLGWTHDVLTPVSTINESFTGASSSTFASTTASPGRDAGTIGVGVSYTPAALPTLAIYTRYDGSFSVNASNNSVTGGASLAGEDKANIQNRQS